MSSLTLWFRPVRVNPRWESSRLHVLARTHLVGLAYPADEDVIECGRERGHEHRGGARRDCAGRRRGYPAGEPRTSTAAPIGVVAGIPRLHSGEGGCQARYCDRPVMVAAKFLMRCCGGGDVVSRCLNYRPC